MDFELKRKRFEPLIRRMKRKCWILDFEFWIEEKIASRKGAKTQRRFPSIHTHLPLRILRLLAAKKSGMHGRKRHKRLQRKKEEEDFPFFGLEVKRLMIDD